MLPRLALPQVTRGLRFRLTLSYVLFLTLLLAAIGVFFRQALSSILDGQTRALLEEEWGGVKGYLRVVAGYPLWFADDEDPEEAAIVARLKRVFLLTDANGAVLEASPAYRVIGIDSADQIREMMKSPKPSFRARTSAQGVPYLIRAGVLIDEHRQYYAAVGRPLAEDERILEQFTLRYFALTPIMILASCLLGWALAGRALRPVNDVARAAQRISGENLYLRILSRGAGDELDRLIETINLMMGRLESSFEQMRQFSTDVSHELRTPITAIRGQLEVALFTAETKDQYRDAILNAMQDVERLSHIVRALLLLAQAESGQLALHKKRIDLAELARDVVDQFQIPAEAARLRLSAELPGECWVEADRIQCERLVSNLLSNAVKYTPAGGEVRVRLEAGGGWAKLVVEDTGIGIAGDHLPHIFNRFYRAPGPQHSPETGIGLGLSFVAWIVKAHSGAINVESEPGKGSRFTVTLPVSPAQAETLE